jgi:hypothetical protein
MVKGSKHKKTSNNKNKIAHIGKTPWNKGKIGVMPVPWNKGKVVTQTQNDKNPNWKGESASYQAKHMWVYGRLGKPDTCKHCNISGLTGHKIHWANISGEYKRVENDWVRLCAKCHEYFDWFLSGKERATGENNAIAKRNWRLNNPGYYKKWANKNKEKLRAYQKMYRVRTKS